MNEINWISLNIPFRLITIFFLKRLIIIRLRRFVLVLLTFSFSYFDVIFSLGLILFCMNQLLRLLLIKNGLMTNGIPDFNKNSEIL